MNLAYTLSTMYKRVNPEKKANSAGASLLRSLPPPLRFPRALNAPDTPQRSGG